MKPFPAKRFWLVKYHVGGRNASTRPVNCHFEVPFKLAVYPIGLRQNRRVKSELDQKIVLWAAKVPFNCITVAKQRIDSPFEFRVYTLLKSAK